MNTTVEAVTTRQSSARTDSSLSDYGLQWLFDPSRHDHLPIEEQLSYYKQRDLRTTKVYKIAQTIWGANIKRKRVHYAPPMPCVSGGTQNTASQQHPIIKPESHSQTQLEKPPSEAEILAKAQQKDIDAYKIWIADRKQMRHDLDHLGVSEEWLYHKPDRTPLENRLLQRMIQARSPQKIPKTKKEKKALYGVMSDEAPLVDQPVPRAIQIIEDYLYENKMRLVDLFSSVDKHKKWKVTREEFRTAIQNTEMQITDIMLEDLILALDTELDDELDYREIAKGMGLWKAEKRNSKRKLINSAGKERCMNGDHAEEDEGIEMKGKRGNSASNRKSDTSRASTSSPRYLTPPPPDTRREERIFSSKEAALDHRKYQRHIIRNYNDNKPSSAKSERKEKMSSTETIKTGNHSVDSHSMLSTMGGGETAALVNKFRQLKLKEYYDVLRLCKQKSISLTPELLEAVLLYPPDKPHVQLKKRLRQPAMPLFSRYFANQDEAHHSMGDKKGKTRTEKQHSQTEVGDDGQTPPGLNFSNEDVPDSQNQPRAAKKQPHGRNVYPSITDVAPKGSKVVLSTGKAVIRRQVDCWLSFEEYDSLTRHLAHKYNQLHGPSDDNAFWPGHLLNKLRLCMPNSANKINSVFQTIVREKPVYALS